MVSKLVPAPKCSPVQVVVTENDSKLGGGISGVIINKPIKVRQTRSLGDFALSSNSLGKEIKEQRRSQGHDFGLYEQLPHLAKKYLALCPHFVILLPLHKVDLARTKKAGCTLPLALSRS